MIALDGLLDPLTGHAFVTAWQTETQKLAVADEEHGERRSEGRRGADALLRLVTRGAARADGSQPNPLIHIAMSLKVAEDTMRRLAEGDTSPLPVDPDDVDGRCETIDGVPIHPHFAFAVLGVAALQRVVMDADSRALDASVNARTFPKWLRHLLLLRSRGRCSTDGCDAPYHWLQADHIIPHSKGGLTRYDTGQMLCRPDNLAKSNR